MKTKQKLLKPQVWTICAVSLCLMVICAWSDLVPPLYVGNLEPVQDQYGRTMIGSHLADQATARSLVEIHTSTIDVILPPLSNGEAHPYNPLLSSEGVGGVGLNSTRPDSGLFCLVLQNPPAAGTKVFARVYNAPTREEATFYADSQIQDIPVNNPSLVLDFRSAQPLDPGDADGDGLNNSWEEVLGIDDRLTGDYDGDGMGDLAEMLAGTAPDDPLSSLSFRLVQREGVAAPASQGEEAPRPVRVKWQSVPGKSYQIEYVVQLVDDPDTGEPHAIIPIGDVVTAGTGEFEMEMLVDISERAVTGTFRVKLVTED